MCALHLHFCMGRTSYSLAASSRYEIALSVSVLLISGIVVRVKEEVCKLVEVHLIRGDFIVSTHNLTGDRFLCVDDVVEGAVNGMPSDEVVAGHVVFLPDTVGAILALTAVGISPRKFHERHVGGSREGQTDTGGLYRADDQLGLPGLESINGRLLHRHGVAPGDADRFGKRLFQSVHNLVEGAEEYQRFAVGKERLNEVNSLLDLTFGRE